MKNTKRMFRGSALILGGGIVLLAGFGGNLKGRADAIAAIGRRDDSRRIGVIEARPEQGAVSVGSSRSTFKSIQERMNTIWRESPESSCDFEMLAEMDRLLGRMTSEEIAAFLRSIPPGFEKRAPYFQMSREIVSWWVLKDGPAALAYMGSRPDAGGSSGQILTAQTVMMWAADQP